MRYYYELINREWVTITALGVVTLFLKPLNADVYIEQNKDKPYGRKMFCSVDKPLSEYDIACINNCLYRLTQVIPCKEMTSELYGITCGKNQNKIQIRYGDEQYYHYYWEYVNSVMSGK